MDEKDVVQDGDHQETDDEAKPLFENVEHLEDLITRCSSASNLATRQEAALQLLQELTFENDDEEDDDDDGEEDEEDDENDGKYFIFKTKGYFVKQRGHLQRLIVK